MYKAQGQSSARQKKKREKDQNQKKKEMVNMHMERICIYVMGKKMRHFYIPIRMYKIQNTENIKF